MSFSYEWDTCSNSSNLPVYGKNARRKIRRSHLYISLWGYLPNCPYIYTRHFQNWEIYTLFISHKFPKLKVEDFKEELLELLGKLYDIHNRKTMGYIPIEYRHETTNNVLNVFLEKLAEISSAQK